MRNAYPALFKELNTKRVFPGFILVGFNCTNNDENDINNNQREQQEKTDNDKHQKNTDD